jgi:hypothetical protein
MQPLIFSVLLTGAALQQADKLTLYAGPTYASNLLYQDDSSEAKGLWQWGIELGVANIVPKIGLKLRATLLKYDAPPELGPYSYKYMPITLSTTFSLLPFTRTRWLDLSLETGFGLYLWQGLYDDEVITLPTGSKMDEKDLGFAGGLSLMLRPARHVALEASTHYSYLTSANIYKYGYYDKDEKLWINSFGLLVLFP